MVDNLYKKHGPELFPISVLDDGETMEEEKNPCQTYFFSRGECQEGKQIQSDSVFFSPQPEGAGIADSYLRGERGLTGKPLFTQAQEAQKSGATF